jgi:hypothetical protein
MYVEPREGQSLTSRGLRHTSGCSTQMDQREWCVERELMADVQVLAAEIYSDLKTPPRPSIWGQRREEIAQMRQRIRTLRAQHVRAQTWTK